MLAGQTATDLDAQLQNLGPHRLAALQIAGRVGIVKDQGVHVAVPGVKHVADVQPKLRTHLANAAQNVWQR